MKNIFILVLSLFSTSLFGQTTIVNQPIINDYAAVTAIDFCKNAMTVDNNAESNYSVGDKVLIIQMQGAELDINFNSDNGKVFNYEAAGSYEYNFVKSINFGSVNGFQFVNELSHPYSVAGKIQIIKVPEYQDVEFQATLTCLPWDGDIGGIIVFEASGNVTLQANVFLDEIGYRGGQFSNDNGSCFEGTTSGFSGYTCPSPIDCGGFKGEGLGSLNQDFKGRGRDGNGGGGGNDHNAGGGGGANGGNGGNGGENDLGTQACNGPGGFGGDANDFTTSNRILMGGAGGGGDSNNDSGTPGGNAGATLIIKAASITSNGFAINANGQSCNTATGDGAGGGGAGGTIILDVDSYNDNLTINANGGNGGDVSDPGNCPAVGGGGSGGKVWVKQASSPANITFNGLGGTKGNYTSATCSGLSLGAQDGENGDFDFSYVPDVSQELFIETVVSAGTDALICAENSTPLTSSTITSADVDFNWFYEGASISTTENIDVTPTTRGINTYTATVTWEVFGQPCIVEKEVDINVRNPDIVIIADPISPVEIGDPVFLNAVIIPINPDYTYRWDQDYVMPNDNNNAVVEPFESTNFCITVTDEIGCVKRECVFVPVNLPLVNVPDAFSPNGDGVNDVFSITPEPQLIQTSLKIYSRWGDLLYESQELLEWDGKVAGEMQNIDTYVWTAEFVHKNTKETSTQSSYVTLIK